jgi:3-dehydroquinate synthase
MLLRLLSQKNIKAVSLKNSRLFILIFFFQSRKILKKMKNNKTVNVQIKAKLHKYEIKIGNNLFKFCGDWAKKCLAKENAKIVIVSNEKIFRLYGEIVKESLENTGFMVTVWLMRDGEKYKNLRSLESLLKFLSENRLTRADAVIALGGGVVGDLAGFASSVFLRGISFLQIPTTLLAMIDSSVGGKTGVNSTFGKNLIGAFHQPNGVLIDIDTLKTLPKRELIAGFCEAIKHGTISTLALFNETSLFLNKYSTKNFKKYYSDQTFLADLKSLLAKQVSFKSEIVMNDEKESVERNDSKSRKILNFGHTLAHAIEKVTDYKYFKHGEAVAYGIIFAAELSKKLEILDKHSLNLLRDVLANVGDLPDTQNIKTEDVFKAFSFDKKNIGKDLQWVLLKKIGQPIIISNKQIPIPLIKKTLDKIFKKE